MNKNTFTANIEIPLSTAAVPFTLKQNFKYSLFHTNCTAVKKPVFWDKSQVIILKIYIKKLLQSTIESNTFSEKVLIQLQALFMLFKALLGAGATNVSTAESTDYLISLK